ncbi:uncharacterized protein LOC119601935 [Lucilia sericata]|uniref:uncharacterized protein LOC119601935 n=1 Tax=Lucilia sericata TaxID=13632 RepID=UPI0018A85DF3|nr:uncharacterized protein LOC119601935 [Lucilia sericata]
MFLLMPVDASDGEIGVSFISAKSKCAPLKCMTIPRLELQAAVLGTRLIDTIMKEHDLNVSRRICWSDSTTVISWISSESLRYKPFVAHRITEILDSTRPTDFRWLPTNLNVADDITRAKNKVDFEHVGSKGHNFCMKTKLIGRIRILRNLMICVRKNYAPNLSCCFKAYFRLSKDAVIYLVDTLYKDDIKIHRTTAIPPLLKVKRRKEVSKNHTATILIWEWLSLGCLWY